MLSAHTTSKIMIYISYISYKNYFKLCKIYKLYKLCTQTKKFSPKEFFQPQKNFPKETSFLQLFERINQLVHLKISYAYQKIIIFFIITGKICFLNKNISYTWIKTDIFIFILNKNPEQKKNLVLEETLSVFLTGCYTMSVITRC